jgi:hypothetical protein
MTKRNQQDHRSDALEKNGPDRSAPRPGGQQLDDGNRQEGRQGGQPGDDDRGNRRGVQEDDRSNRLDVTGGRGGEDNRQEGNKDRQRGGGDERAQQTRNHGQEGGKTARRDNE